MEHICEQRLNCLQETFFTFKTFFGQFSKIFLCGQMKIVPVFNSKVNDFSSRCWNSIFKNLINEIIILFPKYFIKPTMPNSFVKYSSLCIFNRYSIRPVNDNFFCFCIKPSFHITSIFYLDASIIIIRQFINAVYNPHRSIQHLRLFHYNGRQALTISCTFIFSNTIFLIFIRCFSFFFQLLFQALNFLFSSF